MTTRLSSRPLSIAAALRELEGPGLGGLVVFTGHVRPDRTRNGRVESLVYEVDLRPALARLKTIERTARRRFGSDRVVIWHRVGRVRVGEISVVVGAAHGHRAPAFAAARYLIEEVKATVPLWKTERARRARRPPRPRGRRGPR